MKKAFDKTLSLNLLSRSSRLPLNGTAFRAVATARPFSSTVPRDVKIAACRTPKQGLTALFQAWDNAHFNDPDQPLMVKDMGVVERQYNRWLSELPTVHPHYAVKCNPDPVILQTLAENGAGFDCATSHEIETVLDLGVDPERIIFANPVKTIGDLQYAHRVGVHKMTFDNADEVLKIKKHCPSAQVVLRLLPDDSGSLMRFGSKFGAPAEHVRELFSLCKLHDLDVLGVSFHIGSGCFDTSKHVEAIALARSAFDTAVEVGLPPLKMVDIGGGFPGNQFPHERENGVPAFEEFAAAIRQGLAQYFPLDKYPGLQLISEPGRYFATACGTLFAKVCGKRAATVGTGDEPPRHLYYINDGVYGSFNCNIFDHAKPVPLPVEEVLLPPMEAKIPTPKLDNIFFATLPTAAPKLAYSFSTKSHNTTTRPMSVATFFGPTCDSMDVVVQDFPIRELNVGDHLAFENMGAYTTAAGSRFNGCKRPTIHYMHSASLQ